MIPEVKKKYSNHPYRWTTIGSWDHLDAKLEVQDFNKILHPEQRCSCSAEETLTQLKQRMDQNTLVHKKRTAIERETFVEPITEYQSRIQTFKSNGCSCIQNSINENYARVLILSQQY
jgi:hypothetical protein